MSGYPFNRLYAASRSCARLGGIPSRNVLCRLLLTREMAQRKCPTPHVLALLVAEPRRLRDHNCLRLEQRAIVSSAYTVEDISTRRGRQSSERKKGDARHVAAHGATQSSRQQKQREEELEAGVE